MNYKIIKNKKGVTLIELIVAMAIFSVLMLATLDIFKMVIEGQRNAIGSQDIQESMRYALEVMSKEIRMAQKVTDECGVTGNGIYAVSADRLYFKNKDSKCVIYELASDRLQITRGADLGFITPSIIKLSNLKFNVVDGASVQSRVTISTDVEISKGTHKQSMKIQTTVSSRHYE